MKVYLNERPRVFVIVSNNYALIVRHPDPLYKNYTVRHTHGHKHLDSDKRNEAGANGPRNQNFNKVVVEFVKKSLLNLTNYKDITPMRCKLLGFLGLLPVNNRIYLGFILNHERSASPTVGENVYRITNVIFYCLNSDEYDYLIYRNQDEHELQSSTKPINTNDLNKITYEYPAASVRKLLSSGSFYYSKDFDITSTIQERGFNNSLVDDLPADSPYYKYFWWNHYMNSELLHFRDRLSQSDKIQFDRSGFLVIITRGYARTVNTKLQNNEEVLLTMISKQACMKQGPLFGEWGCDDDGQVSNYVETEVIIVNRKICFAYIIVRGNCPTIWTTENSKSIMSAKKNKHVVFPRSFEASNLAFTRHFNNIVNQYGEVFIINLLSKKVELDQDFKKHIQYLNSHVLKNFDFQGIAYHLDCVDIPIPTSFLKKIGYGPYNPSGFCDNLIDPMLNYGALFYDYTKKDFKGKQFGVFRIVSFDSLNKANFISNIISREVIGLAFRDIGVDVHLDLYEKHAALWLQNQECLSNITLNYVSHSSKMHKSSSSSKKGHVRSYFSKKYLSGVVDPKPSETALAKLLGRLQDQIDIVLKNPIQDFVQKELLTKSKLFSSLRDILIFSSTFNVNGLTFDGDIQDWLYPHDSRQTYDVVFIGFQEITELTAGKMVNTDSSKRIFWEKKINRTLDNLNEDGAKYAVMWSGQLGGIAVLLFAKESALHNIRDVEWSFKKTGFGGMSANKGALAVSFNYSNTRMCFVASHLAAGLNNVEERHQNYKMISKGIKFSKNRGIKDHDAVIWLGDFNYRIDLTSEQVKEFIDNKEYPKLFEYDQLNQEMAKGGTFPFYDEMEIKFPPTYKFDNGTKIYDTSEKQRVPAWTDRILDLSRNKIIKQIDYGCSENLIFSDHRPVYASFKISVNIIDENMKRNLSVELYEEFRRRNGDMYDSLINSSDLRNVIDYEPESNILPAPSSDVYKWWLDGGQPAKVSIPRLNRYGDKGEVYVINPKLPSNPFEENDLPEFVNFESLKHASNI